MRVIFMGTPDFAVETLKAIIDAGHEVPLVVTQPDKKKGRGKVVQFTPVKEVAVEHEIPVLQPERLSEEGVFEQLKAANPDVIVVVAYGQILKENVLNLPKYGCVNVHASLLPKYRGAAPIQWSIIDGEAETGVTTMVMAKGLDTGDMLDKVVIPIEQDETGGSLHDKLASAGATLLLETLNKLVDGTAVRTPQTEENTCYAKMLEKSLGNIDWNTSAVQIERLIRGLNPWPSAYTHMNGKTLKLWNVSILKEVELPENADVSLQPGQIVYVDKKHFVIKTSDDYLQVNELQLEGKKRMETDAFLRGYQVEVGTMLKYEK